ncbi:hypothetical protein OBBRIDRAFT_780981 [Obba rivulosa]|uniref:Secreted protein n=1 Tax=Obba rivulosa TaxID=1052685 RepID=A0A8E2DID7_9APHY|nr:hypothetical protein OBBRIDRAFT_780981 [Obba rivulosa]
MLLMLLAAFLVGLLLCCILFPSSLAGDDALDAHEAGLVLVSSRTPFRETGPPACMAKLIMLRHKIAQDNTRRRCSISHTRRAQRTFHIPSGTSRSPRNSWTRFGRSSGIQSH